MLVNGKLSSFTNKDYSSKRLLVLIEWMNLVLLSMKRRNKASRKAKMFYHYKMFVRGSILER